MQKIFNQYDNNNNNNDLEQAVPLVLYQGGSILEKAAQPEALLPLTSEEATTLNRLPKDVWKVILPYLSLEDIMNLRNTSGPIRRAVTQYLSTVQGEMRRVEIVTKLQPLYNTWFNNQKLDTIKKFARFYAPEIILALFVIVLFASLPIDSFQVPYFIAYVNIAAKIVANGTFCALPPKNGYKAGLSALHFPEACGNYSLNDYVTPAMNHLAATGPFSFWFTSAVVSAGVYASARIFFSYNYCANPIKKLITGSALIISASLSMLMPFWSSLGWPEQEAITLACNQAFDYAASYQNFTHCPAFFPARMWNFEVIRPLIPQLAEISPYIIPAVGVSAIVGTGFWAARRRFKHDQHIAFDPFDELKAPVRRIEAVTDTTRLLPNKNSV